MRIGVVGAGAVGGYYGALLVRGGFDVHFLLKNDYPNVRDHGLLVESINGDIALEAVQAYGAAEDMPLCDVVIVALKTTRNHELVSILPKVTAKGGIVVLLQNGLGVEQDISEIFSSAAIIGGLCFLCSQKLNPGHIRHTDYGSIRFGQYHNGNQSTGVSMQLKTVADVFSKAGVPVHLTENLEKGRWEKLVWNMAFNGLTVILNATTGQIMKNAASRSLVRELMLEVIGGARACGYEMEDKFVDSVFNATEQMTDYSPSMKIDFEAGRPLETDSIYWRPIIAAAKNGFDMVRLKVLARQLDFLTTLN